MERNYNLTHIFFHKSNLSYPNNSSVCEALRDIHTGGYIHNDFVLIFGDVFANFNLENAFKEHMRRKREDKMNIMTKVFKKVGVHSISRTTNDDCVIVLDNTNNRVY